MAYYKSQFVSLRDKNINEGIKENNGPKKD
jgi:hypothetical protein